MNYKKFIAITLIELILIMPFYTSIVFAQPEQQGPDIDVELPRYYNEKYIDIKGDVTPNSIVQLYIDGEHKRTLSSVSTGAGIFEFLDVELGEHGVTRVIRISATDEAGATVKEDFLITIDKEKPKLSVEIPGYATKQTLTLNGSVDENSTINIWVLPVSIDTTKPGKIQGLENTSVQPNLVEFEWYASNETDFDRYVIYREDVGAIATTFPADYDSYSDALVNSNETYTYRISAMDNAGNMGDPSDQLTVTTLEGGRTDIEQPQVIDPGKDRGLKESITAAGDFEVEIELGDDGMYDIKLEATDPAGNKEVVEAQTILDTEPPTFGEITPKTGSRIYENYAREVDISGTTKPFTKVKIYVNELKDKEDFSTISDSAGRFEFEEVNIKSYFRGSIVPERVGVGELDTRYGVVEEERGRHARKVTLYFVAEDVFGRTANATVIYSIVTCWEGEFDWDAMPILAYQSPTWLSVERLSEGTEAIYFFFNFTYLGSGSDPRIEGINFQKACDDYIKRDPRYNISCDVMPSSCTAKGNEDNTMQYVACELGRYDGFDNFNEEDWPGFFAAISNEMIFPFRVMLRYSHTIGPNRTSEYQTFCTSATYVVDSSKVDFRDVLPDWMLYDLVDSLHSTVATLAEWKKSLEEVLEYLGTACIVTFGLRTVAIIARRFRCYWEGFQETTKQMFEKQKESGEYEAKEGEQACPASEKKRNKLSDDDLKRDCKRCSSRWNFERSMYAAYRTVCDRVFCHSAPAKWTEKKPDAELFKTAVLEVSRCAGDDRGLMGQTLTPQKCSGWPEGSLDQSKIDEHAAGNECYQAFVEHGTKIDSRIFVKESDSEEGNTGIHHFTSVSHKSPKGTITERVEFYAKEVKGSLKNSYYTANVKTCKEVCGDAKKALCIESNTCLALNAPEGSTEGTAEATTEGTIEGTAEATNIKKEALDKINDPKIILPEEEGGKPVKYSSKRSGYTRDCVFGRGEKEADGVNYMDRAPESEFAGDTLEDTKECCCVYGKEKPPTEYYQGGDYGIVIDKGKEGEGGTKQPKWSYRYHKIKFATGPAVDGKAPEDKKRTHQSYNPDRYIAARDWAGCFGMNHLLNIRGGERLKLDPFKDHIAAFQCVCISGIYNRLQLLSNILTAMENCLITVRTTGTADAGVCEELFSKYVCSLIWTIISSLTTGCQPYGGKGADLQAQDGQILGAVRGGVGALFGGIAESAVDLGSDYGNAQLTNLIGANEEAVVRKICMAAFGFDWDFEIEDVLDAAYSTPYATLVLAVAPKREYLTYDPTNGQSKYEYRGSWIINPGCDLDNYNVYLSCISRNERDKYPGIDCDAVNDPKGIYCDCLNLDREKTKMFYDGRGLTQSVLEDTNKHDIITSQYRFDHLKFVLKTAHDVPGRIKERCFPEEHEDGVFYFPIRDHTATDVLSCYVDVTTGTFNCLMGFPFFQNKGTGYFVDLKLNDKKAEDLTRINKGDTLTLTPTIWKAQGPDLCLLIDWVREGGKREEYVFPVNFLGTQEYPPMIIEDKVGIDKLRMYSITSNPVGGKLVPDPLIPKKPTFTPGETMHVSFYDEADAAGKLSPDKTITISKASKDMVEVNGGGKVEIGSNYWSGDDFILEKGGMAFEINGVVLPAGPAGYTKVTFTIKGVESTSVASQTTKTLTISLVHLKGDNSTKYVSGSECNKGDVVRYQNRPQQKTYRITVGKSMEGACPVDGTVKVPDPCKCTAGAPANDCGRPGEEFKDFKYCYKNKDAADRSCHTYPKCSDTEIKELSIACDCNLDGKISDIVDPVKIKNMNKTCEGKGTEFKYCYVIPSEIDRSCRKEALVVLGGCKNLEKATEKCTCGGVQCGPGVAAGSYCCHGTCKTGVCDETVPVIEQVKWKVVSGAYQTYTVPISMTTNQKISLNITVKDDKNNLKEIKVMEGTTQLATSTLNEGGKPPTSVEFEDISLSAGTRTLTIKARDNEGTGNIGTTDIEVGVTSP